MVRKTIGFMMAVAIMGSVTGCGSKADSQTTAAVETTISAETTGPETTEAPSENTGTGENGAGPGENGTAGEQGQGDKKADQKLEEIHKAVVDAYQDAYIPSSPYDEQAMEAIFGVKSELYDSFIAEGPMVSAHVETFVGIAAKEGKGGEVENALNQYRDNLIEDAMQYPMNIVKIQASQVVRHGDYIFFVMLGGASTEAEEKGEDEALASAKENNQIGIDVINGFFSS